MALHQGDIGSTIQLTILEDGVAVDLTSATSAVISFKKPSGEVIERDGDFSAAPLTGLVEYVVVDGDLDENGVWQAQVILEISGGTFHSTIFSFTVGDILE